MGAFDGINTCTIVGNLTADAELKYSDSGKPFLSGTLAVNSSWLDSAGSTKEKVDFIPFQFWGKFGEFLNKYTRKGVKLLVMGSISINKYEKDGVQKLWAQVNAREIRILSRVDGKVDSFAGDIAQEVPVDDIPF